MPKKEIDRKKYKVCVVAPNGDDTQIASLFVKAGYERTFNLTNADMVVFYGQTPVHPFLYGEHDIKRDPGVFDVCRDKREVYLFKNIPQNVKKIGINRGALLLNILSGGKSYQMVDGHEVSHRVRSICRDYNKNNDDVFFVNSSHRQLMIPPEWSMVLAESHECTHKRRHKEIDKTTKIPECEVVYHWHNETLCCQFTPTEDLKQAREFFFHAVDNYLLQ